MTALRCSHTLSRTFSAHPQAQSMCTRPCIHVLSPTRAHTHTHTHTQSHTHTQLRMASVCLTPCTPPPRVYKLHMTNPSDLTHYFTALEFASKVRGRGVTPQGAGPPGGTQVGWAHPLAASYLGHAFSAWFRPCRSCHQRPNAP